MSVERLLDIASPPLVGGAVSAQADRSLGQDHFDLLAERNGFYAFESALLVRPVGGQLDVLAWNDESGWRAAYGELAQGLFFFAEDVFGGQFAVASHRIVTFDPETGETEDLAGSIEEWAQKLLDDYSYVTGYPVARNWQQTHGALTPGERLLPRTPFVANGEFTIENMSVVADQQRMQFGAQLAHHTATMTDGDTFALPYALP